MDNVLIFYDTEGYVVDYAIVVNGAIVLIVEGTFILYSARE